MKGSKWIWAAIVAAIALFGLFQIVSGVLSESGYASEVNFPYDLQLRRNEILCAHQGVNSFRVWTREVVLPGFTPYGCPDKEKVSGTPGVHSYVHAYPPWHTAFFWFYGWLPRSVCAGFMSLVFGICCCVIVRESLRLARERIPVLDGAGVSTSILPIPLSDLAVVLSLSIIAFDVATCWILLNYGVLVLTAFLVMNKALERNHVILAGLAWALMMVKPQVGLLFAWPLFWHRRYLTITTAAVVCLAGTLFTSFAVHEPVIDLILQIPKIGGQNGSGVVMNKIIAPIIGNWASLLVPAVFFALAGVLTWMLRKNRDFLVSCVPVALIVPIWTYSQGHDHVILLPTLILLIGKILTKGHRNALSVLCGLYVVLLTLCHAWSLLAVGLKVFDPSGLGWIYRLAEYASYAVMLAIAALFVRDSRDPAPPASVHLLP